MVKHFVSGNPVFFECLEQFYKRKEIREYSKQAYKVRAEQGLDNKPVDIGKKSKLCLLAIARGEEPYFIEWIEFHKMMGVDHFFIYDNGNDGAAGKLLEPYIRTNEITLIPFPHIEGLRDYKKTGNNTLSIQNLAYGDFILRYRQNCQWVLVCDIDEFVYPFLSSGFNTIKEYLQTLDSSRVMGMEIPSYVFGSNGHEVWPDGLVIENYKLRKKEPHLHKSIGNASFLRPWPHSKAHDFFYTIHFSKTILCPDPVLTMNHYWVKSLEEWRRKGRINAVGYMSGKETDEKFYLLDGKSNEYQDEGEILRYLDELKDRVAAFQKKREE